MIHTEIKLAFSRFVNFPVSCTQAARPGGQLEARVE